MIKGEFGVSDYCRVIETGEVGVVIHSTPGEWGILIVAVGDEERCYEPNELVRRGFD